jgi:hypothetical protein
MPQIFFDVSALQGGHFVAVEQPAALIKDVEDFIAQVWKTT